MKKKTSNRGNATKEKKVEPKKVAPKPLNPFEVKVNKQKFHVLGQPTKHERGLPGVSRDKAQKKRTHTLLKEYKNRFKSNKMVDKRLGENNPKLTVEGKMEMRFLAEKIKSQNKKSKFLLGDDEVLTHRGQTLEDVERFDDPRSESEDEEDLRLGEAFVSDGHFGGGFLKKTDDTEEARNNRESLIDKLIVDSKKRKEERQKEKEETDDLTYQLDLDYKDILDGFAAAVKTPAKSEVPPVKLPDSHYDLLVGQLRCAPRGIPSDKLRSEEEVARINKEKLDKLETERLNRMKGEADPSIKITHKSADDLDDGFNLYAMDPMPVEQKTLSFDIKEASEQDNQVAAEEEESDDEGSGESGDDDSFSDLASSNEGEDDKEPVVEKKEKKVKRKTVTGKTVGNDEIPFVFKVPEEYDEFQQLMQSFKDQDQRTVLERMMKSNHPSLNGTNKAKLEKVFTFLMQYIHDLAGTDGGLQLLNDLAPVAFDLAQMIPSNSVASTLLDVLMEKREEFSNLKKQPVSVATLVFLKLTALIFPTSDFRHRVTTPAYHVLIESLHRPVVNLPIIQIGLGLSTVAYEFVSLSKRYIPEVIHYLHGVVQLAIPRPATEAAHNLVFPFRPVGVESQLLVLKDNTDSVSIPAVKLKLSEMEYNDQFRVSALNVAVQLISNFVDLWDELPAAAEIYNPILKSLLKLPLEFYNSQVKESVDTLVLRLEKLKAKTRTRLLHEAKKPRPLRLYEPVIEEYFEGRKKRVGSKEKLEKDKLQHKLKREMKGAIREIRKDNAFLGRQKIKEQIEKDNERKRKVKDLMSSLSIQEGEIKKMKKPKKK